MVLCVELHPILPWVFAGSLVGVLLDFVRELWFVRELKVFIAYLKLVSRMKVNDCCSMSAGEILLRRVLHVLAGVQQNLSNGLRKGKISCKSCRLCYLACRPDTSASGPLLTYLTTDCFSRDTDAKFLSLTKNTGLAHSDQ